MIRFLALRAGLTPDEAEEVVQETAIGVARRLPEFVYDPKVCRFKTGCSTSCAGGFRISSETRTTPRRGRRSPTVGDGAPATRRDDGPGTGTIHHIADMAAPEFGADWDAEREKNPATQAMEQVRAKIEERQFQILTFTS